MTYFSRFGFPLSILSDLGTELQSQLMQVFLHEFNISQIRTSVHHPMTNGACEKMNGTLKSMLTAICDQYPYSWDTVLPWVLFAYREVPVETLGCSPFELLFGRSVTGPLSLIKKSWVSDTDLGILKTNVIDFILETRERVRHAVDLANVHAAQQRTSAKTYYEKKARDDRSFDVDDEVLVLLPVPSKPLTAKYYGPYKIVEKLGSVDYVIATTDRRKTRRVCHVNLLKEYHRRDIDKFPVTHDNTDVLLCESTSRMSITDVNEDSDVVPETTVSSLSNKFDSDIKLLCEEFAEIFSEKPGKTDLITHHIKLVPDAKPVRCVPYRLNPEKTKILKTEITNLLEQGLIEESDSPFAAPVILVPKPDHSMRLCSDFRKLNNLSVPDPFPLPRVEDLIDKVGKAKYMSKIDMTRGYWQVPLDLESRPLCGFVTPFGHFQWKVMAFGLRNAPATFSRLVSKLLTGLEEFSAAYLDDIIIFSDSWDDHLKHLRAVFQRIQNAGLKQTQ